MSSINKKTERAIKRKLNAKLYTTVQPNQMYNTFKNELINHFKIHQFKVPYTNANVYPTILTGDSFLTNSTISKKNNVAVSVKLSKETIKIYDENLCNITIIAHPRGIELYRLEIYMTNQGFGSKFMKILTDISFKNNIPIFLIIGEPGVYTGNSNTAAQLRFYKRFGFKKCKNSDYYSNL